MRSIKIVSLAAVAGVLALTPLRADQWDKKTTITINTPMQIPSTTLQPGTYTLKLMDSASDRHIVTVWDKDGMHLITTLLAIPNYRVKPTGQSKFTFWETPADQPAALRAWFYPGDNFGQEFAYPKSTAQQLAMISHAKVPTLSSQDEKKFGGDYKEGASMATTESSVPSPRVTTETATAAAAPAPGNEPAAATEPMPAPVAAAPAPASSATPDPTPAAAAVEATPMPAPGTTNAEQAQATTPPSAMPETASNFYQTMSFGLLLSLTGLSTFVVRKKRT